MVFVVVLYLFGKKPYIHKNIQFNDLEKYFAVLLKRGHNGGFMIVQLQKRTELFVQFSKYIFKTDERGLQSGFPVTEWSKPYYEGFLKCAQVMGLSYSETSTSTNDPENRAKSFVTLDFGRDITTAREFTARVFQDVYGAKEDDTVRLYYGNVDARDREI